MQKDHFFNGGGAPQPLEHLEPTTHELDSSWGCSQDQYTQFELAVSSAGSGGFALSELIGELGNMCGSRPPFAARYADINNVTSHSTDTPSYTTPLPAISAAPGYAERAAKLSCHRSFNVRTGRQFGLSRASSSPSLKQSGIETRPQLKPEPAFFPGSGNNSNAEISATEKLLNPRKRKALSARKSEEGDGHSNSKQSKPVEEELNKDNAGDGKPNQKPSEPSKDYIHVRARRGQATDSHSLAERVRREKISERMKLLQDLVPGCNKVTGKALMLDEIINYVQSLQRQVEFLSMKLATVNPRADCTAVPKETCQSNAALPQPMFPSDSSAAVAGFHGQHQYPHDQIHQLNGNITNGGVSQCPIYSLDGSPNCSIGMQFPSLDAFGENLNQFSLAFEDDLQSIVKMGFH